MFVPCHDNIISLKAILREVPRMQHDELKELCHIIEVARNPDQSKNCRASLKSEDLTIVFKEEFDKRFNNPRQPDAARKFRKEM